MDFHKCHDKKRILYITQKHSCLICLSKSLNETFKQGSIGLQESIRQEKQRGENMTNTLTSQQQSWAVHYTCLTDLINKREVGDIIQPELTGRHRRQKRAKSCTATSIKTALSPRPWKWRLYMFTAWIIQVSCWSCWHREVWGTDPNPWPNPLLVTVPINACACASYFIFFRSFDILR